MLSKFTPPSVMSEPSCKKIARPDRPQLSSSPTSPSSFLVGVVLAGDVIDLDDLLVCRTPIFVGVVQASDRAFLDGAARTAVGVLALGLALVLGWSIGPEVPAARRRNVRIGWSRAGKPARSRCTEAARARAAETSATWPAGTGPAETTRPGPGRTILARTRLADRERASLERLLVESSDSFLGDSSIRVIDESESARPAGLPIGGKHYLGGFSDTRQVISQLCLCCRVRQVANEQTN